MPKKAHPFPDKPPEHIDWYREDMGHSYVIRGGGYAVRIDTDLLGMELRERGGGSGLARGFDRLPFRELFLRALEPGQTVAWAKVIERPTSKQRARFLRHWRVTIGTSRRRTARLRK